MKKEYSWPSLNDFLNLIYEEELDGENKIENSGVEVIALYAFYHYFNADITKIEDVLCSR